MNKKDFFYQYAGYLIVALIILPFLLFAENSKYSRFKNFIREYSQKQKVEEVEKVLTEEELKQQQQEAEERRKTEIEIGRFVAEQQRKKAEEKKKAEELERKRQEEIKKMEKEKKAREIKEESELIAKNIWRKTKRNLVYEGIVKNWSQDTYDIICWLDAQPQQDLVSQRIRKCVANAEYIQPEINNPGYVQYRLYADYESDFVLVKLDRNENNEPTEIHVYTSWGSRFSKNYFKKGVDKVLPEYRQIKEFSE